MQSVRSPAYILFSCANNMIASASIFLEFNLPNATTWSYFSFLLAIALFFKFSRVLSIRNWDVVSLFLLVPGLLVIQGANAPMSPSARGQIVEAVRLMAVAPASGLPLSLVGGLGTLTDANDVHPPAFWVWLGYLWLISGSGYFFIRCLFDLALVQRPALGPNMTYGGLAWLAAALFACLMAVAFRQKELAVNPDRSAAEEPLSDEVRVGENPALALASHSLGMHFWLAKSFAAIGHFAVVLGLILVGKVHFQNLATGMSAATFYLMLPYTGSQVGQASLVWPAALIVWTLFVYRLPVFAGILLGLGAGTMVFPVFLLPLWLGFYWRRGEGRFLTSFLLASGIALLLSEPNLQDAVRQTGWQPWRVPTSEGLWTGLHWAYRMPIFLAYLAFAITTAIWPNPKNLANLIALSAAVLIGIQFWYAERGGIYVLWYLPLLLLVVFRPNLAEHRPVPLSDKDWLARLRRNLAKVVRWFARPEKTAQPAISDR